MRIAINLAGALGADSQLQNAYLMARHLIPLLSGHQVFVFANGHLSHKLLNDLGDEVTVIRMPVSRAYAVLFFTELIIPLCVFFLRIDRIYSPTVLFPIILGNKNYATVHDFAYEKFPQDASLITRSVVVRHYQGLRTAAHVFAISQAIVAECREFLGLPDNHVTLAYNGIPENAVFNEGENITELVNGPYVMYVGMYRSRKNIERMIEGFAIIQSTIPHQLVLVGSIVYAQPILLPLIQRLGITDRVVFTGSVNDTLKQNLLAGASALLLVSQYEGFGLPLVEAQAMGIPVVASDIPVLREVSGGYAFFADPFQSESIGQAIKDAVTNTPRRNEIINQGNVWVKKYSWQETAARVAEILLEQ